MVGKICFLLRLRYFRLKSVSIIFARVDGLPIPFSFINSLISSSSTCLPAVSIAPNKVASEKCLGGLVSFSKNDGLCAPFSPFVKLGNNLSPSVLEVPCATDLLSRFSKTIRQPLLTISFPVVLNCTSAALPITEVFDMEQSS